jgi:hypothetical protein
MKYDCTGAENCAIGEVCCTGTYYLDGGAVYPSSYGGGSCHSSAAIACAGNTQLCHLDCECLPPKKCMAGGSSPQGLTTCQ